MERRLSVDAYLSGRETVMPQELAYGILREPPAPGLHHQIIVGRLYIRMALHVRRYGLGRVVLSPVDVILDRERALVVQPDLVFVSAARQAICGDRICGAPDLVVEVLSGTNRRHDRGTKVGWYAEYGVRECWIVDPVHEAVEVIDLASPGRRSVAWTGAQRLESVVLPRLRVRSGDLWAD